MKYRGSISFIRVAAVVVVVVVVVVVLVVIGDVRIGKNVVDIVPSSSLLLVLASMVVFSFKGLLVE